MAAVPTSRYFRIALSVAATLLCLYLFGLLRGLFMDVWSVVRTVFYPFLAALIISYILQPVVELLHRRRMPRVAAIFCIYMTFAILVVVAALNAVPVITRQVTQLANNLPAITAQISHWMDMMNSQKQYLPNTVRVGLENALAQVEHRFETAPTGVFSFISSTINAVFLAFMVPFLVFYILKDARTIGSAIVRVVPQKYKHRTRALLIGIDQTLGSYIRGQFLVMLAIGVLAFIGYLIIGMPYALLLALFLAITDIIPYIGPIIGIAPAVLIALTVSPALLIKVVIVNIIVQQCEGNLLSPQIMGRTLKLHPMAIVAALLIGGELAGLVGLILAVPVLAVLKVVWMQLTDERRSARR